MCGPVPPVMQATPMLMVETQLLSILKIQETQFAVLLYKVQDNYIDLYTIKPHYGAFVFWLDQVYYNLIRV